VKSWPEFAQKRRSFYADVLKPLGIQPAIKVESVNGEMPPTEVHRSESAG